MIDPYIFSQMVVIGHFGQSIWPSTTALILAINVSRWDGFPLEWNMLDGSDYFLSFYIHSTGTQNRVTGLAMWRGLAKRTQRKSKGKTHQNKKNKNPNPPLLLLGRFRSNGLVSCDRPKKTMKQSLQQWAEELHLGYLSTIAEYLPGWIKGWLEAWMG